MTDYVYFSKATPRIPRSYDRARWKANDAKAKVGETAGSTAGKAKAGASRAKAGASRARRKVGDAWSGATSRSATNPQTGAKIHDRGSGRPSSGDSDIDFSNTLDRANTNLVLGYGAGLAGVAAGAAGGQAVANRKHPVRKARYKVTELGSATQRYNSKRWPEFPTKTVIGSAVGGTAVGGAAGYSQQKRDNEVKTRRIARAKQKKASVAKADYDPKKPLHRQGLAYADKDGRARVNSMQRQEIRERVKEYQKTPERKKSMARWMGGGTAAGAVAGTAVGARLAGKNATKLGMVKGNPYRKKAVRDVSTVGAASGALFGLGVGSYGQGFKDLKEGAKIGREANVNAVNEGLEYGDIKRTSKPITRMGFEKRATSAFGVNHA